MVSETHVMGKGTYCEGVETLLASCVPNLISQDAILQATFLRQESGSNRRLLVGLELVVDLGDVGLDQPDLDDWRVVRRTNRSTTDDFPTAASPTRIQWLSKRSKGV